MARNARTLRFLMVAVLILLVMFKLSSNRLDLNTYPDREKTPKKHNAKHKPAPYKQDSQQQYLEYHRNTDQPYQRANATFLTLARNSELWEVVASIRQVEDRFNENYHYDWVFLNDQPFDEHFIKVTKAMVSGKARYEIIPKEHWSFPEWIDQDKAARVRQEMKEKQIIYGDSISYRHMCRFESGFFWRHPALDEYKYFWRIDTDIKLPCNINYDVFKFMEENNKKYGFTISLYEYIETIPTLWETSKEFLKKNPQLLAKDNMMDFVSDDGGETYNKCHFWSNFEIASLDFFRGEAYKKYFDYLDKAGGFFYERWGDAPVHSIAVAWFLNKDDVHFFEDIGYYHVPFTHCPQSEEIRLKNKCACEESFSFEWASCTPRYYKSKKLKLPKQS